MLRITALRLYRREFFHSLRNQLAQGKEPDTVLATDVALAWIKPLVIKKLFESKLDGMSVWEKWGEILEVVVEFGILLKDMPIDPSKIPPKAPIEESMVAVQREKRREEDEKSISDAIQEETRLNPGGGE